MESNQHEPFSRKECTKCHDAHVTMLHLPQGKRTGIL
jgi:hypothetical protein